MHSSIITFASFIFIKSLSVLSLRLFRTFLYSLSRNGAMFRMFLTFELPKLTFSPCDGCGFTSRSLQIGTISFIMLCNILILKYENMERLSRNFQLFSSFRDFQAIFAPSNSYFTEYSRWVPLSFVKIVVFSEDHHMIQDRNGPIINLDASARSASRIFLFYQRFLLFENVYFFSFLFTKSGGRGWPPCLGPVFFLYLSSTAQEPIFSNKLRFHFQLEISCQLLGIVRIPRLHLYCVRQSQYSQETVIIDLTKNQVEQMVICFAGGTSTQK